VKAVILAGGLGTRISEESHLIPKPMIEIGGKPILWHIMKHYSFYGINEFIICCGYKGHIIKEYFANYFLHTSDVTFDMNKNNMEVHSNYSEPWKVTLVNTGLETGTAGRLKMVEPYIDNERFHFTYGDGVSDVDLNLLLQQHQKAELLATVTAVQPPGRFGLLNVEDDKIIQFLEKPIGDNNWINGGFFILEKAMFKRLVDTESHVMWEQEPLESLASDGQLGCYRHNGFWQPMDTLRDKQKLESLWNKGSAPWKVWNE
jgi:glucose-1-phosphate cytidylyltransferase